MGIRAAEAEGADAGAARLVGPLPLAQLGVDEERARLEVDLRVGGAEVDARRDALVMQRQRGLDDAGHTGRGVEMADVRLQRADGAVLAPVGVAAIGLGERRDLDGITERRPGAVRLHHADAAGVDLGDRQRLLDHRRLALDAGGGEADLGGAVVVDGRPADDGIDGVGILDRVLESLERDEGDAAGDHGPSRVRVEGPHVPVGREDVPLLVEVAGPAAGRTMSGPSGERQVGVPRQQALHGEVRRDPGGRAGGVDAHGWSAQAQLEGGAHHGVLALAREHHGVVAGPRQQLRVRQEVVAEVLVPAHATEDADAPIDPARVVAGVLEGGPGRLQHDAMLGVGQLRLTATHAEEAGVEVLDALHLGTGVDERRGRPCRRPQPAARRR